MKCPACNSDYAFRFKGCTPFKARFFCPACSSCWEDASRHPTV